jgi:hypothetical protein
MNPIPPKESTFAPPIILNIAGKIGLFSCQILAKRYSSSHPLWRSYGCMWAERILPSACKNSMQCSIFLWSMPACVADAFCFMAA